MVQATTSISEQTVASLEAHINSLGYYGGTNLKDDLLWYLHNPLMTKWMDLTNYDTGHTATLTVVSLNEGFIFAASSFEDLALAQAIQDFVFQHGL